uniref:Uncharacterized protein LOC111119356 isoform X2 n=1 Tax=Crassostrea virginica TaxID=6565 RepID=A0A8B8CHE9_CRAVI|nr:uncharacterized protein LOC111119356 isoform X2 [Crassostrea virginica]
MKIPVSLSLFILSCTSIGFSTSNTVIHPASFKSVAVDTILDISCSVVGAATASSSGLQLQKCVPRPNSCQILTPVRRTNTTYYYKEAFNIAGPMLIDFICNSTAGTGNSSHLSVVVGYKPKLPDTVDCISLNKADLKCTWKIPEINLKNSVKSNWTITYSDGAQAYRPCPEPKPIEQESTIHCNIPDHYVELIDTFEPSSNYTMNVTLNNSIGVASRLYQITVSNIVKLTPPTMRIEPRKDTLEVFLELPSDYVF